MMEEMKKAIAVRIWIDTVKQLVKDVKENNFSGKKWCTDHGVATYFIQAAVELGIIFPVGKAGVRILYNTTFDLSDTSDVRTLHDLALRVPETIREVYKNREKRKIPIKIKVARKADKAAIKADIDNIQQSEKPEKTIKDFTIEEIVLELRLRGYEYSISKLEEYTFKPKV